MRRVAFLLLLMLAAVARSQLPGDAATDMASHGWVVVQVPGEQSASLAHVPPRTPTQHAGPAPSGRLRAVATLSQRPTHIAADASSVYMLFVPDSAGERQIMMLSVRPTGVRDLWIRSPETRFVLVGTLTDVERVFGLAVHGGQLHALVENEEGVELLARVGSEWVAVEHPGFDASATLRLSASETGLHVVEQGASTWRVHALRHGTWDRQTLRLPEGDPPLRFAGVWRDEVIALGERDGRTAVWSLGASEPLLLGVIDPIREESAAAILHSTGHLVLAWSVAGEVTEKLESGLPAPEEVSNPVRRIVEFSLIEGRSLYAGPANVTTPVSPNEFRVLAFSLMLMMAVVLLVVLRPPGVAGVVVLPPGLAIAGPGRRLVATAIDGFIGLVVISRALDMSVVEVLGPIALPATGSIDVGPLAMAIMVNIAHCSVSEAFFGRSIGKTMMGLIVARVDAASGGLPAGQFRPPSIGRSFARNMIKWVLPPVAMLALSDPGWRHRGDLIARSAVLSRANEPLSDQ